MARVARSGGRRTSCSPAFAIVVGRRGAAADPPAIPIRLTGWMVVVLSDRLDPSLVWALAIVFYLMLHADRIRPQADGPGPAALRRARMRSRTWTPKPARPAARVRYGNPESGGTVADFEKTAKADRHTGFMSELWHLCPPQQKWWLLPIVVVLALSRCSCCCRAPAWRRSSTRCSDPAATSGPLSAGGLRIGSGDRSTRTTGRRRR